MQIRKEDFFRRKDSVSSSGEKLIFLVILCVEPSLSFHRENAYRGSTSKRSEHRKDISFNYFSIARAIIYLQTRVKVRHFSSKVLTLRKVLSYIGYLCQGFVILLIFTDSICALCIDINSCNIVKHRKKFTVIVKIERESG